MTIFKISIRSTAGLFLLGVSMAFAHHSVSMFDLGKVVTIEGTVKEWQWTNPHAWLQIMAPNSQGTVVEQGFEVGSPNTLVRDGFSKTSFKPGDKVKVVSSPRHDGTEGGLYLCGKTTNGKWLIFGMGPNSLKRPECQN